MGARNRKPTGRPAWSRILLSGEEGAGKSWAAAQLSADERIGGMYWLEVGDGEVTADEYGAIPNVSYDIIIHDGTWLDIHTQLCEHWDLASAAESAGELPVALVVDSMSGIHSMLYTMADTRARRRLAATLEGRGKDPDQAWSSECEVHITFDLHAIVKKRHQSFMAKIMSWPGPVVMTSGERLAVVFDDNGNPTKHRDWTLEARKDLGKKSTAWVRMTRANDPLVIKMSSVRNGVMLESDKAVIRPDFSCANLIFDWVGCVVGESRAPQQCDLNADQVMPDEQAPAVVLSELEIATIAANGVDKILCADTKSAAVELWEVAKSCAASDVDVSGLLTQEDRETLDVDEGQAISLVELAVAIGRYVVQFGGPVRR